MHKDNKEITNHVIHKLLLIIEYVPYIQNVPWKLRGMFTF